MTAWPSALIPASIQPTGVSLQANTAWNMTNMMAARISGPATGWSRTASSRWVRRRTGVSLITAAAAMARARRCRVKRIVARALARADPARADQQLGEAGDDFVDSAAADSDGLDHRDAELRLELGAVELEAVAAGEVDHVEGDDRRQAEVDQLQREAQVVVEIGGVEHDQQGVGQPLALLLARARRRG